MKYLFYSFNLSKLSIRSIPAGTVEADAPEHSWWEEWVSGFAVGRGPCVRLYLESLNILR